MSDRFSRILLRIPGLRAMQATPTPRWIIFTIDLAIIAFVASLVFVFPPSFFGANPATQQYSYFLIIVMYAAWNLLTGAYRCIIRFSVPYDLLKTFWCVLGASVCTCLVSLLYALLSESHRLLIGILPVILIGTVAMSLMMSLRIIVKYLYGQFSMLMSQRKPVVVLGTSLPSLGLAATLKHESDGEFMPVALFTTDEHHPGKLQGLPVLQAEAGDVAQVFRRAGADTLIFLSEHTELLRSGLADRFIDADIKLKVLNQVEEYDVDDASGDVRVSGHVSSVKIEDLLGRPVIHTDSHRVCEQLHGATVLVTGAAGSIGSEIVRQVARFAAKTIILLDQAETPMHDMQLELQASFPDADIYYYVGDVQNKERLHQIFERHRPTHVYHAAAYKHVPMMERNPSEAILTNVMGTRQLADLALQYGVRKFVMISTDKAVNPTNIMGASKRIAEIYVQSLFFRAAREAGGQEVPQFITTRFGNVLGSNGSVIPLFRRQIEEGGPVTLTHRDIIRYFMTIQEACSLVLEAGSMGHGGEIFLFDMGQPVKIYDLARRMILLAGLKPDKDIKIVETGLRPGEKLYEELLNDKEKTLPTGNDKIMIARVREYDFQAVLPHIERLIALAAEGRIHDMVTAMKGLVPEYISNNSRFEAIDRELGHTRAAN